MARRIYIVSYDIADPRRLRQVARLLEGFGSRIQYSVFECPLDKLRLEKLKARLKETIQRDSDQILFIDLGSTTAHTGLKIESMGLPYLVRSRLTIV